MKTLEENRSTMGYRYKGESGRLGTLADVGIRRDSMTIGGSRSSRGRALAEVGGNYFIIPNGRVKERTTFKVCLSHAITFDFCREPNHPLQRKCITRMKMERQVVTIHKILLSI